MQPFRTVALAFAVVVSLVSISGSAAQAPPGTVTLVLGNLWTTATPPGAETVGGYLTITNTGAEPDRLVAASSPLAATGTLHQMQLRDGIASMTMVDGIDIPAGGSVTLGPTGFHVMFVGVKALKEGDELPVILTFARVGQIETYLHVLAIGSRGPQAAPRGPSI